MLKIKAELLPERCEICHKNDLFDAQDNYCFRCAEMRNDNISFAYERTHIKNTAKSFEEGLTHLSEHKYKPAVVAFKNAILDKNAPLTSERPRRKAEAYYYLGLAYAGLNCLEEAKQAHKKALCIYPGLVSALNTDKWFAHLSETVNNEEVEENNIKTFFTVIFLIILFLLVIILNLLDALV